MAGLRGERDAPEQRILAGGFTRIPNFIIDGILPFVNHTDGIVLIYLLRKTLGWNVESENITLREIQNACGTGRSQASRAAQRWVRSGLFRRIPPLDQGRDRRDISPVLYILNADADPDKILERLARE